MNEMASQVISGAVSQLQVLDSFIEMLPYLYGNFGEDRTNEQYDIHAVAIYRDTEIVGHVPYLAPRMSAFFMREDKAFAEITGAKVNRGAGCGLEVSRIYCRYGPNVYVKELVESLLADGHIICILIIDIFLN